MRDTRGKLIVFLLALLPVVRGRGWNVWDHLGSDAVRDLLDRHPSCRRDLDAWRAGVEAKEMWALQMLDASTKLPPGLLTGNLIDYGNYDECIGAEARQPLVPQHCAASLDVPARRTEDNSSLNIPVVYRWSYCLPQSCPAELLQSVLSEVFETVPIEVNVTVLPEDCRSRSRHRYTVADVVGICVWSGAALLAAASTVYDVAVKAKKNPWLSSFSVYTNLGRLLNTDVAPDTLLPLNGLRFLSIAWIILGHRYYFTTLSAVMNLLEVPEEFEKVYFQIFVGGVLAVDTFFLLSGLLNAYLLLKFLDKSKFQPWTFYIHRYLRTTPALAAVVLMYASWFVLLGTGPAWDRMTSYSKKLCQEYWWPTLLYINNYYNPVNQCAGQSWYLAVDMQLYWLSPLVILPIWKWPGITKFYLGLLLAISTVGQFVVAYVYKFRMPFSISLDMSENTRVVEMLYVPTHTRATPYIIGIMVGVYLDGVRNRPEKPKWPKMMVILGWLLCTATCLSVLFGNYPFFRSPENHPYNRIESSFYISFHRIGWGAGISWIILSCLFGYGGAVNSILSWKLFIPLSRLTYCIFLCHMAIQQYQLGTSRTAGYYQMFDEIHRYFGDLVFAIGAATVLSLLFESPATVLEKLLLKRGRKPKSLESYTNKAFQET
ncbi:UNVERIFIED_CONTAM: hypothetical protein PYX00_003579 [Menopon gallinae]|uniref:Nose resistant-to-fluoxetine protein N-terminal domain-containing protein n=1 Tax=Menopon gallinae TaxID=328185 RepID=A0AAW2I0X8_9NEOP